MTLVHCPLTNSPSLHSASLAPHTAGGAALLVHGGAWSIPEDALEEHRAGLRQAIACGRERLEAGASALEAAVETVAVMEAHGAFDAGRGSVLNRDGEVELDAGAMDGATLAFGAVLGIRHTAHPSRLARYVLREAPGEARILAGAGAEHFLEAAGLTRASPASLVHPREAAAHRQRVASGGFRPSQALVPRGTVGCVARDRCGHLAVCTSTGGTPFKPAGRVGDTPLVGAGFYADAHAAVCCTGWGEAVAARVLAVRAADAVAAGARPEDALRAQLTALHAAVRTDDGRGAAAGVLLLGADGTGAWAFTSARMARGGWHDGGTPWLDV
jgi:L-asparaginase / beta-aspartyl-peptidase